MTGSPVRSVSVLIPTLDGAAFLDRVMQALSQQRLTLPWELLIIDSGSHDGTLAIINDWQARFPVPMIVRSIHHAAFNHGDTRNALAAHSDGDLLVYLTQDAIPVGPRWLETLVQNFIDPAVAAAYCRNVPRPDAHVLTRIFSEGDFGYRPGRHEQRLVSLRDLETLDATGKRLLFNCNNVAAAYRRSAWEHHPFPHTAFGEDVLMARALIEGGYTVVYDDRAIVEHSHDYAPGEMYERAVADGRFNAEWLDRICVANHADVDTLTRRQLERDKSALADAGLDGPALREGLAYASRLRHAAFAGLHEGGRSTRRRPSTRLFPRSHLRVLYVVHAFPPDAWAGTEVYTLNLALEMQRLGHDVTVLTRTTPRESSADDDFSVRQDSFRGLRVRRMVNHLHHTRLRDSYDQPRAAAVFKTVLAEVRPDVVHFQHLIHLSADLPLICRALGVPSVITVNDYWALCARVQLYRPDGIRCDGNQGLGCLACINGRRVERVPVARALLPLATPLLPLVRAGSVALHHRRLHDRVQQIADVADRHAFVCSGYAACDLAIAPSRFLRDKLLATGYFDHERVVYSDYGIRTDGAPPPRPSHPGSIRFGYVGSLVPYKGLDVLLGAMARLGRKNTTLHLFGAFTPERDAYHRALAALAVPAANQITFHGHFDNASAAQIYESIDVLVVPSTWFENSPLTIHEAFVFGKPVVTSNLGGMAELVEHERNGLLFEPGSVDGLTAALRRFIDEPALLARLSVPSPVKSIAEDAREMASRYRALACIVRGRDGLEGQPDDTLAQPLLLAGSQR